MREKLKMSERSVTTNGETGPIVCPRSLANADLLSEYKLHYATLNELKANGGICAKCAAKIRRVNAAMLAGREIREDSHNGHYPAPVPDFHAGWEDDDEHKLVPTIEFNFDDVDAALGIIHAAPRDARTQAAELFRQLLIWCFAGNPLLRTALVKFTTIAAGLRPEILDDRTMTELAMEIGVTKQAMSKQATNFSDAFGIKFGRGRSKESRARMADARRGGPPRNFGTHPIKESPTPKPPLVSNRTAGSCCA
jgi:hypothetical protein